MTHYVLRVEESLYTCCVSVYNMNLWLNCLKFGICLKLSFLRFPLVKGYQLFNLNTFFHICSRYFIFMFSDASETQFSRIKVEKICITTAQALDWSLSHQGPSWQNLGRWIHSNSFKIKSWRHMNEYTNLLMSIVTDNSLGTTPESAWPVRSLSGGDFHINWIRTSPRGKTCDGSDEASFPNATLHTLAQLRTPSFQVLFWSRRDLLLLPAWVTPKWY